MYPYNLRNNNYVNKDIETEKVVDTQEVNKMKEVTQMKEEGDRVETDDKILTLIEEAIGDEFRDYEYYKRLQALFDEAKDKETIRHISLDEMKHKKMLEELYFKLSGQKPPLPRIEDIKITKNLLVELAKSIASEFDGTEFYRKLYFLFKKPEYRDMMFELLHDEHIHAGKLTYLYSKYK